MTKSFTGFLQYLAIRWLSEFFVEVCAGTAGAKTQNTDMSSERRGYSITAWKVHQNASLGSFDRLECSRNMFVTGEGDYRGKPV